MSVEEVGFDVYVQRYGSDIYQEGDLYIPSGPSVGTICLLHGGFWRIPYNRFQLNGLAKKLVRSGFVVWNVEYRRIGDTNVSCIDIFNDTIDAINALVRLKSKYPEMKLDPLFIAGHSAGGHLALWSGKKNNGISKNQLAVLPAAVIGLAPVVDLRKSFYSPERQATIYDFLGSTPSENDALYKLASPIEMLPLGIPQWIFHGVDDEMLPISEVDDYVDRAKKSGDEVRLIKIDRGTHMSFLDPDSTSIYIFVSTLLKSIGKDQYASLTR